MIVLLPPSESKATRRRGARLDLAKLSFPELTEARQQVAAAVSEVSARDEAPEVLGVSPNLADEIARHVWPHVASGELRPVIDRVFPLGEAAEAHRRMEAGDHIGKIVLTIG